MKKVKIINHKTQNEFGNILEDPTEWIADCVANNYWGLPERWVQAKELLENGNPNEPEHWVWHSERYEDSDVLRTEERKTPFIAYETNELGHTVEVQKERIEKWVLLKAEYTVEVVDLDNDYDWLLSECHRKRREEYPPVGEYLDAVVKGDEVQVSLYVQKCLEVKAKYPKPNKGGA